MSILKRDQFFALYTSANERKGEQIACMSILKRDQFFLLYYYMADCQGACLAHCYANSNRIWYLILGIILGMLLNRLFGGNKIRGKEYK